MAILRLRMMAFRIGPVRWAQGQVRAVGPGGVWRLEGRRGLMIALALLGLGLWFMTGCREEEVFETLGRKIAHPAAIDQEGEYFYVVNADFERRYNSGSLMVLNEFGEKIGVLAIPRLGRFVVARGSVVLVGHGATHISGHTRPDAFDPPPFISVYDASEPRRLKHLHTASLQCSPINADAPPDYPYFVVSCMNGQIYVGQWDQAASPRSFKVRLVRDYGPHARRAITIDTARHLVYAFTTDWDQIDFQDQIFEDRRSYREPPSSSGAGVFEEGSNEIPDVFEELPFLNERERQSLYSEYQLAIYPLRKEAKKGFPYASYLQAVAQKELRWLYFHTPDEQLDDDEKFYRSNFWQIHRLAENENTESFLISQRGAASFYRAAPKQTNAIYKFTVVASPFEQTAQTGTEAEEGEQLGGFPLTSSFLQVQRVWGHPSDASLSSTHQHSNLRARMGAKLKNEDMRFTGNFSLGMAHRREYMVINDFRDASLFDRSIYSLTVKVLGSRRKKDAYQRVSTDRMQSYFAVAALKNKVLSGAFYSNTLSLFEMTPTFRLRKIREIY